VGAAFMQKLPIGKQYLQHPGLKDKHKQRTKKKDWRQSKKLEEFDLMATELLNVQECDATSAT